MKHLDAHPSIRTYRQVETTFFGIFKLGSENQTVLLLIMVLFTSITASLRYHHIGLRAPKTKMDYRVYSAFMVAGNALLSLSTISQYNSLLNSGVELTTKTLAISWLWIALFVSLTVISLV